MYERRPAVGSTGCHADGRNPNQGAESTLAMIATMQQARALVQSPAAGCVDVAQPGICCGPTRVGWSPGSSFLATRN